MGKVKIKSIREKDPANPYQVNPILLRFQHATTTNACSAKGLDVNDIFRTAVFQSDPSRSPSKKDFSHLNSSRGGRIGVDGAQTRGRRRQLLAVQSDSMTYLGESTEGEAALKTYVGLRQGKRMRLFEVTPITVKPFIKDHSYVVEKERETGVKKTREEKKAEVKDLVKSFGSKKKVLTYERIEKNQIATTDMNESMSKASTQIRGSEEEPKIKDESVLTLIPPCNRQATSPEDVYDLEDILERDEFDSMDDLAREFVNMDEELVKEWQSKKRFSDYFFAMWRRFRGKQDTKSIRCAKLVVYTELLIALLKLRHEQLRKKVIELPDVFPSWLTEKALESFTHVNAKGIRNRPEALKDKTACYVMVLVLLANDFVLDVQLMSTSLNIHIKKLLVLAKAVGVTLTYNNVAKEHRGSLRLPLPKPIENRGRRRVLR